MRVLSIEDEIKTAIYLAKGLEENGFIVDVAHDGEEGWQLAAKEFLLLSLFAEKVRYYREPL